MKDVIKNKENNLDIYDFIFGKFKCTCLDSAYERKAINEGLNNNPVFDENKEYIKRKGTSLEFIKTLY